MSTKYFDRHVFRRKGLYKFKVVKKVFQDSHIVFNDSEIVIHSLDRCSFICRYSTNNSCKDPL